MLKESVVALWNLRIAEEEQSSRLYLAMSLYLEDIGYSGAAKLWKKFSQEELGHAEWVRKHLLSFGILPQTAAIPAPKSNFESLAGVITETYAHEEKVTMACQALAAECIRTMDMLSLPLALRFTAEQVEEMEKVTTLTDKLTVYGNSQVTMQLFDRELEAMAN